MKKFKQYLSESSGVEAGDLLRSIRQMMASPQSVSGSDRLSYLTQAADKLRRVAFSDDISNNVSGRLNDLANRLIPNNRTGELAVRPQEILRDVDAIIASMGNMDADLASDRQSDAWHREQGHRGGRGNWYA